MDCEISTSMHEGIQAKSARETEFSEALDVYMAAYRTHQIAATKRSQRRWLPAIIGRFWPWTRELEPRCNLRSDAAGASSLPAGLHA